MKFTKPSVAYLHAARGSFPTVPEPEKSQPRFKHILHGCDVSYRHQLRPKLQQTRTHLSRSRPTRTLYTNGNGCGSRGNDKPAHGRAARDSRRRRPEPRSLDISSAAAPYRQCQRIGWKWRWVEKEARYYYQSCIDCRSGLEPTRMLTVNHCDLLTMNPTRSRRTPENPVVSTTQLTSSSMRGCKPVWIKRSNDKDTCLRSATFQLSTL
jgi:hypothetical protein